MTKNEAIALYESEWWKHLTDFERAKFQLFEDKLCMPFDVFHKSIEATLDRPVCKHEFGRNHDGLQKELLGDAPAPTIQEIMDLIPEDKRIVVNLDEFDQEHGELQP